MAMGLKELLLGTEGGPIRNPTKNPFWTGDAGGMDIYDLLSGGYTQTASNLGYGKNPLSQSKSISGGTKKGWEDVTGQTSANAAKDAATIQAEAAKEANEMLMGMYQQNRTDMIPWLESGKQHLGTLDEMMSQGYFNPQDFEFNYQESPGYQFLMDQGMQGVQRGAAAKGGLRSGATDIDILKMAQGLASQDYGNQFNRSMQTHQTNRGGKMDFFNQLSNLSGRGQTQSQSLGNLGQGYGANSANLMTGGANAQAAGLVGAANAQTQGTQNLLNMLMQGGGLFFG